MDVRISDMTAWCRNDQCRKCDGGLKPSEGSAHWWCICHCHGDPAPPYLVEQPGAGAAYWQWIKARLELDCQNVHEALGLPRDCPACTACIAGEEEP